MGFYLLIISLVGMLIVGAWDHFHTKTSILQNLKKSCTIDSVQFEGVVETLSSKISFIRLSYKKKQAALKKKSYGILTSLRHRLRKVFFPEATGSIPSSFILYMRKGN